MRALGIDLGGASVQTTGYAVVDGKDEPSLERVGMLDRCRTPLEAEDALVDLIDRSGVDVVAIDAPLTLPPCLTCPSYCRGPGVDLCEIEAARDMWAAGSNPVSRRPCEMLIGDLVAGLDPKPTMGLGVIAARGVALTRRLRNRGLPPALIERGEIVEVYPRATLLRLGRRERQLEPRRRGEHEPDYRSRVVAGLSGPACNLRTTGRQREAIEAERAGGHQLDAVIAAYTGWLGPDRLQPPPEGFNVASGWIWFPH